MRTTPATHTLVIIPARAPIDSLLNLSPLLAKDSLVDLMGATQGGRLWAVKKYSQVMKRDYFFENVKGLLEFVHSSSSHLFIIFVIITFIATTIIIIIITIYSKLIFCRF